jgi:sec-independent protein translocase protein TatA
MPSWIGGWEIALVLVLVLVIFGPKKLPELGASLGKSIRGFKKGLKDSKDEVKSTVADVREAAGIDEMKSTVAEVREAADLKGALKAEPDTAEPASTPDKTEAAD